MSSLRAKLGTWTYRAAAALPLHVPQDWSPTFLIGCGRSGTTFLVSALNQHPEVLALNEPRHIWRAVDPRTDIWDSSAASRGAKVVFQASDASPGTIQRCRRAFRWRLLASRKQQLVEKLPINNFRLAWIDAIFPNAKYINLVRNGLDVARSIEQKAAAWYGGGGWKWKALQTLLPHYGLQLTDQGNMLDDFFQRGLLEWTLSVSCNRAFLEGMDASRCVTLRYEDLITDPEAGFTEIFDHLGLSVTPQVLQQIASGVRRHPSGRRPTRPATTIPAATQAMLSWYNYPTCSQAPV